MCPGGSSESNCTDGTDNDCDGDTDCADSDCDGSTCGANGMECSGGACNCSGNGGIPQSAESLCMDGNDNDCDGNADCNDGQCQGERCSPVHPTWNWWDCVCSEIPP